MGSKYEVAIWKEVPRDFPGNKTKHCYEYETVYSGNSLIAVPKTLNSCRKQGRRCIKIEYER